MTNTNDDMLIPLADFERMFRTIHGVLLNETGDLNKACLLFAVIGAAILHKHHNLKAGVVAGFGAKRIDESPVLLIQGGLKDGVPSSKENEFHCWVEYE